MSETATPQTPEEVAEKTTETFETVAKEFESLKLDTTVPESVRVLAEKTVNQTREAYERGKESLEESVDALERSFDAAAQGPGFAFLGGRSPGVVGRLQQMRGAPRRERIEMPSRKA